MNTLESNPRQRPIGVFDSGVGGLTVAAALRTRLPGEKLLYLGDVARLPYGTKAPQTVVRYALKAAEFFAARDVKMMVLACNTVSAHAVPALSEAFPDLLVLGVIDSGAEQAARRSKSGRIVVAATESTCRSRAFDHAIDALRPGAAITPAPCPLFVALAEEGLTDGPIAEAMIRQYLADHFHGAQAADCLVLGCTHFPLLLPAMREVLGDAPEIVDCAQSVADKAAAMLHNADLIAEGPGDITLFTTEAPLRFAAQAGRFMPDLGPDPQVELVDV